ncbi:MAG: NADH-quinone oxidoreductase subunit NuoK [Acidimicrobiia bacterium]|jgi:NADH-quinone oxidoreductase subunit K
MTLSQFLVLSAGLFSIGVYGVLIRRNAVLILLSVEVMLAAVNINLVAFGQYLENTGRFAEGTAASGQVFALFVITVAAAEVGIGLAIVLLIFRNRSSVNVDELDALKW